ncbi:PAS domain S-box protein [Nitrosomonas marina]|uniref:histidine kinase n=1 Tax=Nitrosomonas marina TaxID=917 RepID=A0A1H8H3I5_9PROT|nr:PAS domain S-box protein [Nitrosomonas marina]SEN50038.1 PAS domain S-box-containing protein [Nitrosomonas marina]
MANHSLVPNVSRHDCLDKISFRELFDAAVEAKLLVDAAGHIVMANCVAQRVFEYSLDEMLGLEIEALVPERYREHHRKYRKMYLAEPYKRSMGNSCELKLLKHGGQEMAMRASLSPIYVETKIYILVTISTLDRRGEVEQALQASEERFRLIQQAAGAGVFDIDCANNRVYCDSRMCELLNNGTEEIMALEKFFAVVHPDDRVKFRAIFDDVIDLSTGNTCRGEFRVMQPPDQRERWVAILGQAQFENGKAKRVVGIARDITERKLLEKALQQQRSEIETLFSQQVAIITASAIAHEINSPLTAVAAYSDVAHRALSHRPIEKDKAQEALEGCIQQALQAGRKLHELIEFLQKREIQTEKLNLNRIIEDALLQLHSDGYGAFHLALDLEPDMPLITANKIQVQKVLVNLIKNSVQAMRGEGTVHSEIAIILKTLPGENMAIVTIRDNGPGIDEKTISHVFDPFFTTKPTGFGVGLSISRALIEANGGQLWIDPDFREGAQFHFTLPYAS